VYKGISARETNNSHFVRNCAAALAAVRSAVQLCHFTAAGDEDLLVFTVGKVVALGSALVHEHEGWEAGGGGDVGLQHILPAAVVVVATSACVEAGARGSDKVNLLLGGAEAVALGVEHVHVRVGGGVTDAVFLLHCHV